MRYRWANSVLPLVNVVAVPLPLAPTADAVVKVPSQFIAKMYTAGLGRMPDPAAGGSSATASP